MTPGEKYRLKVYKDMFAYMEIYEICGFCRAYVQTQGRMIIFENYPELFKYKPWALIIYLRDGFWFPFTQKGFEKRKRILRKIIAQMESPYCTYYG